jgi:hypothetical protein
VRLIDIVFNVLGWAEGPLTANEILSRARGLRLISPDESASPEELHAILSDLAKQGESWGIIQETEPSGGVDRWTLASKSGLTDQPQGRGAPLTQNSDRPFSDRSALSPDPHRATELLERNRLPAAGETWRHIQNSQYKVMVDEADGQRVRIRVLPRGVTKTRMLTSAFLRVYELDPASKEPSPSAESPVKPPLHGSPIRARKAASPARHTPQPGEVWRYIFDLRQDVTISSLANAQIVAIRRSNGQPLSMLLPQFLERYRWAAATEAEAASPVKEEVEETNEDAPLVQQAHAASSGQILPSSESSNHESTAVDSTPVLPMRDQALLGNSSSAEPRAGEVWQSKDNWRLRVTISVTDDASVVFSSLHGGPIVTMSRAKFIAGFIRYSAAQHSPVPPSGRGAPPHDDSPTGGAQEPSDLAPRKVPGTEGPSESSPRILPAPKEVWQSRSSGHRRVRVIWVEDRTVTLSHSDGGLPVQMRLNDFLERYEPRIASGPPGVTAAPRSNSSSSTAAPEQDGPRSSLQHPELRPGSVWRQTAGRREFVTIIDSTQNVVTVHRAASQHATTMRRTYFLDAYEFVDSESDLSGDRHTAQPTDDIPQSPASAEPIPNESLSDTSVRLFAQDDSIRLEADVVRLGGPHGAFQPPEFGSYLTPSDGAGNPPAAPGTRDKRSEDRDAEHPEDDDPDEGPSEDEVPSESNGRGPAVSHGISPGEEKQLAASEIDPADNGRVLGGVLPILEMLSREGLRRIALAVGVREQELSALNIHGPILDDGTTQSVLAEALSDTAVEECLFAPHAKKSVAAWLPLRELMPAMTLLHGQPAGREYLSSRAYHLLRRHTSLDWEKLAACTLRDLRDWPSAGRKMIAEILRLCIEESLNAVCGQSSPAGETLADSSTFSNLEPELTPKEQNASQQTDTAANNPGETISEQDTRALPLLGALHTLAAWGYAELGLAALHEVILQAAQIADLPTDVRDAWEILDGTNLRELGGDQCDRYDPTSAGTRVWNSLDPRFREILALRTLALDKPATLGELGERFNISRERARQLEAAALDTLRFILESSENQVLTREARRLRARLGKACPVDTLAESCPNLLDDTASPDSETFVTRLLLWLGGPYEKAGNWLLTAPAEESIAATVEILNRITLDGPAPQDLAAAELAEFGIRREWADGWIAEANGFKSAGKDLIVRWGRTVLDKAETVLLLRGQPMSKEEVAAEIGEPDSVRYLSSRILSDSRFVRRGRNLIGLRRWGGEEYTSIVDEIVEEIARQGGEASIDHLVATLTTNYGVSENSVKAFAGGPRFARTGRGTVRLREAPASYASPPIQLTRRCFKIDGHWSYRLTITEETFRGSGTAIPPGFAQYLGVTPLTSNSFSSGYGPIYVGWPSVQPNIGSLKRAAEELQGEAGDYLFICRAQDNEFAFSIKRKSEIEAATPIEQAVLMVGATLGQWADDAIRAIGHALGIDQESPPTLLAVRDRLRAKGDADVLALLPEPSESDGAPDARALDELLSLFSGNVPAPPSDNGTRLIEAVYDPDKPLVEQLLASGLRVVDQRPKGGRLWVEGEAELSDYFANLKTQSGVRFRQATGPIRALDGGCGWWTE